MTRRVHAQDGSLPFAMLGILVVTAIVVGLVTRTVFTLKQTTDDREFQSAVLGADAGVQQALTQISVLTDNTTAALNDNGEVGDVAFEWEARRSGSTWQIESWGTDGDAIRKVEAQVERPTVFTMAAFADVKFIMSGNNGASSYNSATGDVGDGDGTGNGSVGTNGSITLRGSAFADRVDLFGPDATCDGNGCSRGDGMVGHDDPFDLDALADAIADEAEAACGGVYTGWQASRDDPLRGGTTYCLSEVNFDTDTDLIDASIDNPVVIYLDGELSASNHTNVNCSGCDRLNGTLPDASALQIYSNGESVRIGVQAAFAAALLAPAATCQGNPAGAQADIYGSMICDIIGRANGGSGNQGGWRFHFDDHLMNLANGKWDITGWREEPGDTTSF